jgi:hypothetical protein
MPQVGEWMVCVHSYRDNPKGETANQMARQMVAELRGPHYKLPAYTFNHGAAKRKEERERVEKLKEQQEAMLRKFGAKGTVKIRVKTMNYEEQVAVLIGGYRDMETARQALEEIKKLPAPDPNRVKLDGEWMVQWNREGKVDGQYSYVNPFTHGFVVRNPSLPSTPPQEERAKILRTLKTLNANEPYSLLNCPKKYTLAVKEFRMPTMIHQEMAPQSILEKIPGVLGLKKTDTRIREDQAGLSAHNLAEFLHTQTKFKEAYVLHNSNYSIVTIGSFEAADDPALLMMQQRFMAEMPQPVPGQPPIGFYAVPVALPVPR